MNENLDLTKILEGCPEGTEFYSTIYGEVRFVKIDYSLIRPIIVKDNVGDTVRHIASDGRVICDCGECTLFPSKDQRDWDKFRIPTKKGDVIMFNGQVPCLVTGDYSQDKKKWVCGLLEDGDFCTNIIHPSEWCPCFYTFATEEVKDKLFEAMDKAGYTWDGETLKKKEPQFKPFEKVLVRDSELNEWRCTFYSHFDFKGRYNHNTISGAYVMCIPFEGNEHLVGTTKNP